MKSSYSVDCVKIVIHKCLKHFGQVTMSKIQQISGSSFSFELENIDELERQRMEKPIKWHSKYFAKKYVEYREGDKK